MKKENKTTPKKTINFIGLKMSSNNFFALILCIIIGIVMIYRTFYINQKLTGNTETIIAEVIDIYRANHGQRLWGYEMKYKYVHFGSEIIKNTAIQKNEIDNIKIGDCIEIIVSVDDSKIQRWNKSKGTFKCK